MPTLTTIAVMRESDVTKQNTLLKYKKIYKVNFISLFSTKRELTTAHTFENETNSAKSQYYSHFLYIKDAVIDLHMLYVHSVQLFATYAQMISAVVPFHRSSLFPIIT
jgi:hypothetical protein